MFEFSKVVSDSCFYLANHVLGNRFIPRVVSKLDFSILIYFDFAFFFLDFVK